MNLKDAKKGARVKTVGGLALGPDTAIKAGMRGRVFRTQNGNVGVCLGKGFSGHDLDGALKTETGYWFAPDELTLVAKAKPAKKRARR